MNLLIGFYELYLTTKESSKWGPTLVRKENQALNKKI